MLGESWNCEKCGKDKVLIGGGQYGCLHCSDYEKSIQVRRLQGEIRGLKIYITNEIKESKNLKRDIIRARDECLRQIHETDMKDVLILQYLLTEIELILQR